MRRFYKTAVAAPAEGGFAVHLDGKPIRTPAKRPLIVPSAPLAEAIAGEWAGQGKEVEPLSMPLMRLACTAVDRVAGNRDAVVKEIAGYAQTDLLCYRAEHPPELAERQSDAWQPLLDWALMRFDARLTVVDGVMPQAQSEEALRSLHAAVADRDDLTLVALNAAVVASGSLIVGLALLEGEIDAARAFEVSQIDESYSIETWGEDEELTRRREIIARDIGDAERFMTLVKVA
ncbi:MAG: ATPase [Rhodospirillaceae bacterium]|nr:ATPase [Rhodospirillaceae bacterium]|tara:strand:+ start:261 stop:959 length:699 start_codon:yes stop_codon:yes gene_type:complete